MPRFIFGVDDLPYSHTENLGTAKKGKNAGRANASTTGDVAEILEEKYGILQYFWKMHQDKIVACMEEGLEGAFESLLMGAPPNMNAFAAGSSQVEGLFQAFLTLREMDGKVGGVPTLASLGGVSHRFKKKVNPRGARPSFVDTGLYRSSFRSEVK